MLKLLLALVSLQAHAVTVYDGRQMIFKPGTVTPDPTGIAEQWLDWGAATAIHTKYTMDGTTGSTASDGLNVGFTSDALAEVWNFENTALRFATNNLERMRILSGGNVGIGTTAASTLLSLDGQANRAISMERRTGDAAGLNFTFGPGGAGVASTDRNGGNLILKSGISTGTGSSAIEFQTAAAGTTGTSDNTPITRFYMGGDGSMGYGTSSPTAKVHIAGAISRASWTTSAPLLITGGTITDTTGSGSIATRVANTFSQPTFASSSAVTVDNAASVYISNGPTAGTNTTITNALALWVASGNSSFGGRIGIGTVAPQTSLEIIGAIGATAAQIRIANSSTDSASKTSSIVTNHYTNAEEPMAMIHGVSGVSTSNLYLGGFSSSQNAVTSIGFYTAANNTTTTGTYRGGFDSSGNFGLGGVSDPQRIVSIAASSVTAGSAGAQIGLRSLRTAIVTGDLIAEVGGMTNDTNITAPGRESGRFGLYASETHTNTANGTDFIISSSPNGSTIPAEVFRIKGNGNMILPTTVTAGGTTGNQTINKISGTVNFAAAATAVTVTNSLVTTSSIVLGVLRTNDTTCTLKNIVPGSGSFVITMTAACAAETSVGFVVIN